MADVFLSYSRRDQAFVHRLQEALVAHERTVWVDWRDIPPTAEWLQEVYAGIEASDAVICVLSPDFAASEICHLEVAHAIEYKKRLVPIVWREIAGREIDATLAALNWIYAREQDDFDTALATLLSALDTDLAYVRESTKLLVRAREWEAQHRRDGFVLHGDELEEAERWLAQGADKTPSPTALQLEYITTSRKVAQRRQRRVLTAVSVALAITVILSVATFVLYRVAEAQRQVADTNYKLALSRQLAAEALNHLDDQRDLALLLSVEAYRRGNTVEARNSLLTAIERQPRLAGFLQDYGDTWTSVAFDPKRGQVAAISQSGSIVFWDANTRKLVGKPITGTWTAIYGLTFSPDGQKLAAITYTSGSNNTAGIYSVAFWSAATRQQVDMNIPVQTPIPITSIAFNVDSRLLGISYCYDDEYYATQIGSLGLVDTTTGTVAGVRYTATYACFDALAFSPDGKVLAAGLSGLAGGTLLVDATTRSPIGSVLRWTGQSVPEGPDDVDAVAFSPDGTLLAVGGCQHDTARVISPDLCDKGGVQLWDMANTRLVGTPLVGHTDAVVSLAFSPDGVHLATAASDNTAIVWNVVQQKQEYTLTVHPLTTSQHSFPSEQIAYSPDGRILASTSSADTNISLWNMTTDQPLASSLPPPSSPGALHVASAAFSPDGSILATAGCRATDSQNTYVASVWLWQAKQQRQVGQFDWPGVSCVDSIAVGPGGKTLATNACVHAGGAETDFLQLWDANTHAPQGRVLTANHCLYASTIDPTGTFLAAGSCISQENVPGASDPMAFLGHIWLWNIRTHQEINLPTDGQEGCVQSIAFSPDGKNVAAGVCSHQGGNTAPCLEGQVQVWDITHKRLMGKPLVGSFGEVKKVWLGYHTGSDKLIAGAEVTPNSVDQFGGGALFWDVNSGQRVQVIPDAHLYDGAFSQNGALLLIASCTVPSPQYFQGDCSSASSFTLQLWDTNTDIAVGPPLGVNGYQAVAFAVSSDGSRMATLDDTGKPLLWDLNPDSWAALACHMAARNMTRSEWDRYLSSQEAYRETCPGAASAPSAA